MMAVRASDSSAGCARHSPSWDEAAHLPAGPTTGNSPLRPLPGEPSACANRGGSTRSLRRSRDPLGKTSNGPCDAQSIITRREYSYDPTGSDRSGSSLLPGGPAYLLACSASISATFGLVVYTETSRALLRRALSSSSPNMLANAQMITPDAAASSLGVAATCVSGDGFAGDSWKRAIVAGVAMGWPGSRRPRGSSSS